MEARKTQDTAALMLVGFVGIFIFGSLVILVIGAFVGYPADGKVWAGLFSLCTAILGAIGGYLGGQAVGRQQGQSKQDE